MNTDFCDIKQVMKSTYGDFKDVKKSDAPISYASDTGMFNALFGRMAFTQFNQDAVLWNLLAKKGWVKSGWRIRTARGVSLGGFGVTDAGSIPDTVKSTIVEVVASLKQVVTTTEIGNISFNLTGDDVYTFEEEMKNHAQDHVKLLNSQLHRELDTKAGTGFESIDRVCASNGEVTDHSVTAGDGDIYGLDRDSATTYDAYVDYNASADRDVSITMVRSMIETIEANSGQRPTFLLTGYDQRQNILSLMESQVRYTDKITVGINGINTANGYSMGSRIAEFDGLPIFADAQTIKDTGSRIYALNSENVFLGIKMPTKATMSITDQDMLNRGTLTRKAMYLTGGELVCTMFSANGKCRDLL